VSEDQQIEDVEPVEPVVEGATEAPAPKKAAAKKAAPAKKAAASVAPVAAPAKISTPDYPGRPLRRGSDGEMVRWLQGQISTEVDGVFGHHTEKALRVWQRRHKLASDGVAGPKTWRALTAQ